MDCDAATDNNPAWDEVGSTGLCYRIDGSGPTTVVLIHELGGSMASWDVVTSRLSVAMQVIRYDQRGQGRSPLAARGMSLDDHAADVLKLLDEVVPRAPVWLVAAAAGAAIAVSFAAAHPGRVRGLVLCGPALDIDPARRGYLLERAELARAQGMQAIVDVTLDNSWPACLRVDAHAFEIYRERFLAQDAVSYARANELLSGIRLSSELDALALPCLLLAGEFDRQRPPERVAALARVVRDASFAVVPDAGHLMAVQQPEGVAARISRFIAENA